MKQILAFAFLPLVWAGSLSAAEPVYDVVIADAVQFVPVKPK